MYWTFYDLKEGIEQQRGNFIPEMNSNGTGNEIEQIEI
jgi:hypothetical protein